MNDLQQTKGPFLLLQTPQWAMADTVLQVNLRQEPGTDHGPSGDQQHHAYII